MWNEVNELKKDLEYIVKTETELLPFLLESLRKESRNYVKGALGRGQILLNGKRCKNHAAPLKAGDKVTVLAHAPVKADHPGFSVIHEDDEIIVINKPAGLLSVSTDDEKTETAYRLVNSYLKKRTRGAQIFIVHRLDRDTSGVMLFAKTERMKLALQDNWDELVTIRRYAAVVEGIPHPPEDSIKSWLKQTRTLLVYSSDEPGDGKRAVTNYKTLSVSDKYALLDINLETGRKNQIRVHMKDIGHPIAGDKKYSAKTNPLGRLCLHATQFGIRHPETGVEMRFSAEIPGKFKNLFSQK